MDDRRNHGPNASGKSNVIDALYWLFNAVRVSLRFWDDEIAYEPFRFGTGPISSTKFEVEMLVQEVRYVYQIEFDRNGIRAESLYSYPERRRRLLFRREGGQLELRRGITSLSGIRELLTNTMMVLSIAAKLQVREISSFASALSGFGFVGNVSWNTSRFSRPTWHRSTQRIFEEGDGIATQSLFDDIVPGRFTSREMAMALLRFADLGIIEVQIPQNVLEDLPNTPRLRSNAPGKQLKLIHGAPGQELAFDFAEESEGTRRWFSLIGPILKTFEFGQVLIIDEIDAGLHSNLSARLVELFQDPSANPNNAQLIFTTHDTSLSNHLNRDEVWFTEKGANGSTSLKALAEFSGDMVRRSLNLEKAYLQGRFGGIPYLDQLAFFRLLGPVASSD
nr:ATP-binding protein [Acidithrix ferrooxidans]